MYHTIKQNLWNSFSHYVRISPDYPRVLLSVTAVVCWLFNICRIHRNITNTSVLPDLHIQHAVRSPSHVPCVLDHSSQLSNLLYPDAVTRSWTYDSGAIHLLLRARTYHSLHHWSTDLCQSQQDWDTGRQRSDPALWSVNTRTHRRSCCTSGPVNTGMGDRILVQLPVRKIM